MALSVADKPALHIGAKPGLPDKKGLLESCSRTINPFRSIVHVADSEQGFTNEFGAPAFHRSKSILEGLDRLMESAQLLFVGSDGKNKAYAHLNTPSTRLRARGAS